MNAARALPVDIIAPLRGGDVILPARNGGGSTNGWGSSRAITTTTI